MGGVIESEEGMRVEMIVMVLLFPASSVVVVERVDAPERRVMVLVSVSEVI